MEIRRTTEAPADHVELAKRLSQQKGRLVHPDVLVEPTCFTSVALRNAQEKRRLKQKTGR